MTNTIDIVEKLSLFNNLSFTKKQWDIILKGCGCPKSSHFWAALRNNNLQRDKNMYTLIGINAESFEKIWIMYCASNTESVMKSYKKKKAIKRAQERRNAFMGVTLYLVDGALTDIKPGSDD